MGSASASGGAAFVVLGLIIFAGGGEAAIGLPILGLGFLDRISVCQPRELSIGAGERLQLKANRSLASGRRVSNGELVSVKAVAADGSIKLKDGRVLDSRYREFQAGYAITSYGSQGKTADYVLFSDSTLKGATNAQQWHVSISRGRRGIGIFTPDKQQLRENITRSGERPLAVDLLRSWERKSPFFRLLAERFGSHAAHIFERSRRPERRRGFGERPVQPVRQFVHPAQRQSRGIRI